MTKSRTGAGGVIMGSSTNLFDFTGKVMAKKLRTIRSGKHTYAFHEIDLDKKTRVIVQENHFQWVAYIWRNPPTGTIELVGKEFSTEAAALDWLKHQIH